LTCDAFVHEGVVGVNEDGQRTILEDRTGDKSLGLFLESLQQTQVVVGINDRIHHDFRNTTKIQPLRRKICCEGLGGPRIRHHPSNFFLEVLRIGQLTALSQGKELIVRDAAPQEEREP